MKRCPKCEFTFDDHQELCDFDGAELSVVPEVVMSLKNLSACQHRLHSFSVSSAPA